MRLLSLPAGFTRHSLSSQKRPLALAAFGLLAVVVIIGIALMLSSPGGPEAEAWPTTDSGGSGGAADGGDVPGLTSDWGSGTGWQSSLWTAAALILVLGVLYGSLWLIRTVAPQARLGTKGQALIEMRSSLRLNGNQALHLVQFGQQLLLIGSSQAGLSVLARAERTDVEDMDRGFEELMGQELRQADAREGAE